MSRRIVPALVILGALVLTGCTAEPAPVSSSPVVAAPSPEPTPTETAIVIAQPEQVFGGDCDAAFDPTVISSAWGGEARLVEETFSSPDRYAVEQLGGIICTWADSGYNARADLVVLPVSAVAPTNVGDPFCYGPCSFGVESAGLWLSGVVSDSAGDETASRAILAAISDAFETAAATQINVDPAPGASWVAANDCEALPESAAIRQVLDEPSFNAYPANGLAEVAEGRWAAISAAGVSDCMFEGDATQGFTMSALPGGAWMEDELRRSGYLVDTSVAGAQSAFFLTREGSTALEVFADGSWMELTPSYGTNGPSDTDQIAAAGALVAAMPRA